MNVDGWTMDKKRMRDISSRFFYHPYTNCSPFALVVTLGFLEMYHSGNTAGEIAAEISNRGISMKMFLRRHLPGQKGRLTQIALYLQGMKYSRSNLRQSIRFNNPQALIDTIVKEQLEIVRAKQQLRLRLAASKSLRFQRQLDAAAPFKRWHVHPKLFSQKEVDDLNRNRKDKLELLSTGLLRHHCCYPNCPDFLVDQRTHTDKETRTTRHGLMRHLRYDRLFNNYSRGFHVTSKLLVQKTSSFDTFCDQMRVYFKDEPDVNLPTFQQDLDDVWKQMTAKTEV